MTNSDKYMNEMTKKLEFKTVEKGGNVIFTIIWDELLENALIVLLP